VNESRSFAARSGRARRGPEVLAQRRQRLGVRASLLVGVASSLVALALGELAVRSLGRTDEDGAFYFREHAIRPYRMPLLRMGSLLDEYERSPASYLAYDADLGWTNRPGARSTDGLYRANAAGLRSDREYSLEPSDGVLRIGLFGDSFVHGDGVELAASLAPLAEAALRERGVRAEVLNFGVPGYGIDQAYLRYLQRGRRFRPALVLLGLQLENVARDASVVRALYHPSTRIPFTKPRFVLEGDAIRAVNRPTLQPRAALESLRDFESSGLRRYEFFYRPADFAQRWYRASRLLAVAADGLATQGEFSTGPDPFAVDGEPVRVTLAVLEAFRRDVSESGSRFELLYLPLRPDWRLFGRDRRLDLVLREIASRFPVIDPRPKTPAGVGKWPVEATGADGWHYSAEGNRRVARALADWVVATSIR